MGDDGAAVSPFSPFARVLSDTEVLTDSANEDVSSFLVFFDEAGWRDTQEISGVALSKQYVFGAGDLNTLADGWRIDANAGTVRFSGGDEVRALNPLDPDGFVSLRPEEIPAFLSDLRVSAYGIAGLEYTSADSWFYFLGLGSILGRTEVSTYINHDLFGPRLGLGAVAESGFWRFEAVALGSVGYGWWERRQNGVFGEQVVPGALNRSYLRSATYSANSDRGEGVVWSGEARLLAGCQLTQRLRFDAMWRWTVIGPVHDAYQATRWNVPEFGLAADSSGERSWDTWFLGLTYTH